MMNRNVELSSRWIFIVSNSFFPCICVLAPYLCHFRLGFHFGFADSRLIRRGDANLFVPPLKAKVGRNAFVEEDGVNNFFASVFIAFWLRKMNSFSGLLPFIMKFVYDPFLILREGRPFTIKSHALRT